MIDETTARWEAIYRDGNAGSYMNYPSDNLVTLFYRYKNLINLNGKCLDYGFGSAANSEFLIQNFAELFGQEVSESSLLIANKRLSKYKNFNPSYFYLSENRKEYTDFFDCVVAWQVMCYNSMSELINTIKEFRKFLRPSGLLFCTLLTDRDIKTRLANKIDNNTFQIDDRIPHQEGCIVNLIDSSEQLQQVFQDYKIIDFGHFERISYSVENGMSEYYIVAQKL